MKLQTKRKCLNNSLGNLRVLILTHHISIAFCGVGDSLYTWYSTDIGGGDDSSITYNQQQQQKTTTTTTKNNKRTTTVYDLLVTTTACDQQIVPKIYLFYLAST